MKRCPQCEFIYEDDQSLCDMDGILLVYDTRKLPKLKTSSTVPDARARWRSRLVTSLAALILGVVLFLVYQVSTQRSTARVNYAPGGNGTVTSNEAVRSVTTDVPTPAVNAESTNQSPAQGVKTENSESQPGEAKETTPVENKNETENAAPTRTTSKPVVTPAKKPAQVKPSQPKSSGQNQNESTGTKIGSFFKKTGKLIKKPFQK